MHEIANPMLFMSRLPAWTIFLSNIQNGEIKNANDALPS